MEYYQILKQRRLALGLSIQDISSQTRLAPQYIQAVEENNLMVFNEDFLFIRRFTQAYCEAIGVNWQAISQDVESNISAYAQRSGMVFEDESQVVDTRNAGQTSIKTDARGSQKRHKPKPRKRKGRSRNPIQNLIHRINQSEHARIYQIGAIILALVLVLSLINVGMSYQTSRQQAAEEAARQSEIKQKEAETKRLASQKKTSEKDDNDNITITATDKDNNTYDVDGIIDGSKEMTLKISVPEDTTIAVYKDDDLLTDDADQVYTSTFEKKFDVKKSCTIQVEIGTYVNNTISVNGKKVSFSKKNWEKGTPAVLYFNLKSDSDDEKSDTDETDTSTDTSNTDSSTESADANSQTTTTDQSSYDASAINGGTDDTANVDPSTYDTYSTPQ